MTTVQPAINAGDYAIGPIGQQCAILARHAENLAKHADRRQSGRRIRRNRRLVKGRRPLLIVLFNMVSIFTTSIGVFNRIVGVSIRESHAQECRRHRRRLNPTRYKGHPTLDGGRARRGRAFRSEALVFAGALTRASIYCEDNARAYKRIGVGTILDLRGKLESDASPSAMPRAPGSQPLRGRRRVAGAQTQQRDGGARRCDGR